MTRDEQRATIAELELALRLEPQTMGSLEWVERLGVGGVNQAIQAVNVAFAAAPVTRQVVLTLMGAGCRTLTAVQNERKIPYS